MTLMVRTLIMLMLCRRLMMMLGRMMMCSSLMMMLQAACESLVMPLCLCFAWPQVDVRFAKRFKLPIALSEIKVNPKLKQVWTC